MRERRARAALPVRFPLLRRGAVAIAPFRSEVPRTRPPLTRYRRRRANPAFDRTVRDSPYAALDNDSKVADAANDVPSDCYSAPKTGLVFGPRRGRRRKT